MANQKYQLSSCPSKYLVWVLTIVGIASGGLMLAIVGWSLFGEISSNRLKQDGAQKEMARLLNSIDIFMDNAKSATSTLLTDEKMSGDEKFHLSFMALDKDALSIQSYSMEFNTLIDDMSEITLNVTDLYGQCTQYSQQAITKQATRNNAHLECLKALKNIRSFHMSEKGMEKLKMTAKIIRYRRAEGEEAHRLAHSISGEWTPSISQGQIQSELSDIALLCERLFNDDQLDHLVDLKDNDLLPSLSRLNRSFLSSDGGKKADLLRSFEVSLFGEGFQVDREHQTLIPGKGGLYTECREWLVLQNKRNNLTELHNGYAKDFQSVRSDLIERADSLAVVLSKKSDDSVATAWIRMVVVGSACSLIFLVIAKSISSTIVSNDSEIAEKTAQIQESSEYIENILGSMSDALTVVRLDGIIEMVNESACQMLGYQKKELVGRMADEIFYQSESENENENENENTIKFSTALPVSGKALCQLLKDGILSGIEGRYSTKEGVSIPVNISAAILKGGESGMRGAVFVAQDISERKHAEEKEKQLQLELSHAQKLESVGQLAAGIAHEINTPTQYVADNTRFLKDGFGDLCTALDSLEHLLESSKEGTPSEQLIEEVESVIKEMDVDYLKAEIPQAIDQSLHGVTTVARIVRAMKEFSHPGSSEKTLFDLANAIETTTTVARSEWKYAADMVMEFDSELPKIPCLPGEINQVILNLVVNASHAITARLGEDSTDKGTITVGTRQGDNWVEFFVRDTGTGIPEDVRQRIFDPFFTTKGVGKGTGQGLAIAHSVVVDKHSGTIRCETELGEGTTFIVRLPIDGNEPAEETALVKGAGA